MNTYLGNYDVQQGTATFSQLLTGHLSVGVCMTQRGQRGEDRCGGVLMKPVAHGTLTLRDTALH
jgi:hypothetical protein